MEDTVSTNATTTQAAENAAQEQQQTSSEAAKNSQNHASGDQQQATNLEKLIQSAVDRATNKMGNEIKKLKAENDGLKKANMDADEVKKFELSEKEKEIAEREKALLDKENRLFAIKALKEVGLDDGSADSLAIVDFVMADNEEGITERVKAFDALVKRIVKTQVDGVFKANGRTPGVGTETASDAGGKNESLAVRMGRNTASNNKAAQSVLDHYLGGKK